MKNSLKVWFVFNCIISAMILALIIFMLILREPAIDIYVIFILTVMLLWVCYCFCKSSYEILALKHIDKDNINNEKRTFSDMANFSLLERIVFLSCYVLISLGILLTIYLVVVGKTGNNILLCIFVCQISLLFISMMMRNKAFIRKIKMRQQLK